MEKIVKKLFITGTLLVGLAVSASTLGYTSAINVVCNGEGANAYCDQDVTYTVTVPKTLILKDVAGVSIDSASTTDINTDNISAHILANTAYQVKLSATQPDLLLNGTSTTSKIPAITGAQTVEAGKDLWGIKKDSAYVGIGTQPTWQFSRSPSTVTDAGEEKTFEVGIGVSPSLAAGTYSTVVTMTLSTNP